MIYNTVGSSVSVTFVINKNLCNNQCLLVCTNLGRIGTLIFVYSGQVFVRCWIYDVFLKIKGTQRSLAKYQQINITAFIVIYYMIPHCFMIWTKRILNQQCKIWFVHESGFLRPLIGHADSQSVIISCWSFTLIALSIGAN